jgi:non-heme chloroperoxidase
VPVLLLHGDDDQVVPIADSALIGIKLLKHGTLKVYPGYPHGAFTIHADVINPDLLAWIEGEEVEASTAAEEREPSFA